MKRRSIVIAWLVLFAQALPAENAADLVARSGIGGGIVVHVGCEDGREAAEMLLNGRYLVHGLDTRADHVAKARAYLRSEGLYGSLSSGPCHVEAPSAGRWGVPALSVAFFLPKPIVVTGRLSHGAANPAGSQQGSRVHTSFTSGIWKPGRLASFNNSLASVANWPV